MMNSIERVPAPRLQLGRRGLVFVLVGLICTVILGGLLVTQPAGFQGTAALAGLGILSVCTFFFLRWIPNPIPAEPVESPTRKGLMVLIGLAVGIPLFVLPVLFDAKILYALPVLAVIVLLALRRPVTRRELGYAVGLAFVAALAGLGAGWIHDFPPALWAGFQLALVIPGLLCGWKILQHSGLAEQGVGYSRFLNEGAGSALRGFALGAVLSLPWAFANVLLGGAHDNWVSAWWQPLIAIQPGIAEEAWGRMLMVPLLFLAFRRAARPRLAFTVALLLAAYWFAYLHTEMGLNGLASTVMLGTLYALPISYLCLYRDLETAIGFHFWIDFVRFLAAFLLLRAS